MTAGAGWWPEETPPPPVPPAGATTAQQAGATAATPTTAASTGTEPTPDSGTHPARLALGMAVLAAERLRPGSPASDAFATGVGLLQQTAAEARTLVRRFMGPPGRIALRTVDWASSLSGSDTPRRSLSRSREILGRVVSEARKRGEATVAAGRADASAFVQANVSDGIAWAQAQAVPQIVDGLVPHLVDEVMPRLIDGALPEIRARVLPVVIDDLTNDPRVRDLVLEQGRSAVDEAAQHLRSTTASADDRVESAFRRLVHGPPTNQPPAGEVERHGNG